jgi:hypothetical protein
VAELTSLCAATASIAVERAWGGITSSLLLLLRSLRRGQPQVVGGDAEVAVCSFFLRGICTNDKYLPPSARQHALRMMESSMRRRVCVGE